MDDYYKGLCDTLIQTLELATQQKRDLLAEIKELRAVIRERDPDLWALSEENQALQMQLASLKECKHGLRQNECGYCDDERRAQESQSAARDER